MGARQGAGWRFLDAGCTVRIRLETAVEHEPRAVAAGRDEARRDPCLLVGVVRVEDVFPFDLFVGWVQVDAAVVGWQRDVSSRTSGISLSNFTYCRPLCDHGTRRQGSRVALAGSGGLPWLLPWPRHTTGVNPATRAAVSTSARSAVARIIAAPLTWNLPHLVSLQSEAFARQTRMRCRLVDEMASVLDY